MSRGKSILIAIVIALIGFAGLLWIYSQPKPKPQFEIVGLTKGYTESIHSKIHYVEFKIANSGAGNATFIHGKVIFENGSLEKEWFFYPIEHILKPGETTPFPVRVLCPSVLNEPTVSIVVECYEGVTQEFTKYLST